MHIALLAPGWPLHRYPNGIVTYVHWMRREFQQQGHRVTVFVGSSTEQADGVVQVRMSFARRARNGLMRRLGLGEADVFEWGEVLSDAIDRLHRRSPIDVIEMEESFGWNGAVQRRTAVPVVVKLHGPAFLTVLGSERETSTAQTKIEREGAALRGTRFLTAPSAETLKRTVDHYGLAPEIVQLVTNPITLPDRAPIWSLDGCDRNTLLFVGRFDWLKGGDLVLQAFGSLHRENPSLRLVFVGPDTGVAVQDRAVVHIAEAIRSTLSLEAASCVDYRGAVSPADIYGMRASAFITIVASRWENYSYTALEAMLQGCPLVSSDAGGQAELVVHGRTGSLFKAGDAADLSANIGMLVRNPQHAAAIGAEARRQVQIQNSPAAVVGETLAIYRQAIEAKRSNPASSVVPVTLQ